MDQVGPTGQVTTIIHLVHNASGEWRLACMPNMTEFGSTLYHQHYPRSDDLRAVTCPQCKTTAAYKTAQANMQAVLRRAAGGK